MLRSWHLDLWNSSLKGKGTVPNKERSVTALMRESKSQSKKRLSQPTGSSVHAFPVDQSAAFPGDWDSPLANREEKGWKHSVWPCRL
jgi:hypothetical protein